MPLNLTFFATLKWSNISGGRRFVRLPARFFFSCGMFQLFEPAALREHRLSPRHCSAISS
jgi:hypothetical protein